VVTEPVSSIPSAAITECGVSLHQVRPVPPGRCAAAISTSKKSERPAAVFSRRLSATNCAMAASVLAPRMPSIGVAS
jgi:hypothetical protein